MVNGPDQWRDDSARTSDPGIWSAWSKGRLLAWALLLLLGDILLQMIVYTASDSLFWAVFAGSGAAILLPCHLLARSVGGTLATEFHLGGARPRVLFWAAVAAVASLLPTSMLAELSARLHPVSEEWLQIYLSHLPTRPLAIAGVAVTVVLVAPAAEEVLFRGILHRLARRQWGSVPAGIISALVFSLAHNEPWYMFGLFGLGILLAFIYEKTRSVTACAVTHGVHNAISFGLLLGQNELAAGSETATGLELLLLLPSLILLYAACRRLITAAEAD